eukprot:356666-Chlamydomonas_euryale.AAC.6
MPPATIGIRGHSLRLHWHLNLCLRLHSFVGAYTHDVQPLRSLLSTQSSRTPDPPLFWHAALQTLQSIRPSNPSNQLPFKPFKPAALDTLQTIRPSTQLPFKTFKPAACSSCSRRLVRSLHLPHTRPATATASTHTACTVTRRRSPPATASTGNTSLQHPCNTPANILTLATSLQHPCNIPATPPPPALGPHFDAPPATRNVPSAPYTRLVKHAPLSRLPAARRSDARRPPRMSRRPSMMPSVLASCADVSCGVGGIGVGVGVDVVVGGSVPPTSTRMPTCGCAMELGRSMALFLVKREIGSDANSDAVGLC